VSTEIRTPAGASSAERVGPIPEVHVYEPHRVGLPPLRRYAREVWRRRQFVTEMSRTSLRAQHYDTALGQLWLLLNPLLLTLVYFLLVDILRHGTRGPRFFAHLMAGLFLYHFFSQSVTQGAKSVVGGGKLILNTAFPRTLLPLSSVLTAFMRFLPTIAVYGVMHVVANRPFGLHDLLAIPILALIALFALGVCMIVAATQVYFRDVANFLPYLNRIWMYGSPVLYYSDEMPEKYRWLLDANPLGQILVAWSDVLNAGHAPAWQDLAQGSAWAFGLFVVGALFFLSRERDFAVRL
jgi:teichoic acid transport system permease protein